MTAVSGRAKRVALNGSSLRGRKSHHLQSCFVGEVLTQSVGLARNPRMCLIHSKWEKRWRDKREVQGDLVGRCMFLWGRHGAWLKHPQEPGWCEEVALCAQLLDRSSCQPCSGGNAPCSSYPVSSHPIDKTLPPSTGIKEPMCFL